MQKKLASRAGAKVRFYHLPRKFDAVPASRDALPEFVVVGGAVGETLKTANLSQAVAAEGDRCTQSEFDALKPSCHEHAREKVCGQIQVLEFRPHIRPRNPAI